MVARAWDRAEVGHGGSKRSGARIRAATPIGHRGAREPSGVEERFVQNEAVSLCLLLNARAKTMRVIDFRAGPSFAKRLFVLKLAKAEGLEKIYTLVERDEVSTWQKLGFTREANIPGFYKRSDAFILGCVVDEAALSTASLATEGEDDPDAEQSSPARDRMEKTLVQAKKATRELNDRAMPQVKVAPLKEAEARKAVDKQLRAGRALTAFEPFGRDVERRYLQLTTRGGFELVASTEAQSCFGNAFVELLTGPKTEADRVATAAALRTLCDTLLEEGVVSCFAMTPSDDVGLASAFVWNGFRRTGVLANHLAVGGARKDAIVWSRKLSNPNDD